MADVLASEAAEVHADQAPQPWVYLLSAGCVSDYIWTTINVLNTSFAKSLHGRATAHFFESRITFAYLGDQFYATASFGPRDEGKVLSGHTISKTWWSGGYHSRHFPRLTSLSFAQLSDHNNFLNRKYCQGMLTPCDYM